MDLKRIQNTGLLFQKERGPRAMIVGTSEARVSLKPKTVGAYRDDLRFQRPTDAVIQ